MFRFDQLIRRDMIIRDVKQRHHGNSSPYLTDLRYRSSCDDCDIENCRAQERAQFAGRREALNQAAFGPKADYRKCKHPVSPPRKR